MLICPRCSYPVERPRLVGAFTVECSMCPWKGAAEELVEVADDGQLDPKVFEQVANILQAEIAPHLGQRLIQLGLLSREQTENNIYHISRTLAAFSRTALKSIIYSTLAGNYGDDDERDSDILLEQ